MVGIGTYFTSTSVVPSTCTLSCGGLLEHLPAGIGPRVTPWTSCRFIAGPHRKTYKDIHQSTLPHTNTHNTPTDNLEQGCPNVFHWASRKEEG